MKTITEILNKNCVTVQHSHYRRLISELSKLIPAPPQKDRSIEFSMWQEKSDKAHFLRLRLIEDTNGFSGDYSDKLLAHFTELHAIFLKETK